MTRTIRRTSGRAPILAAALLGLALAPCAARLQAAALVGAAAASGASSLQGVDRRVAPGDDFFRYANGGWLAATPIPADRSDYGSAAMLTELTAKRTAELIKSAAASATPGSAARQVGDYYASLMDAARIERLGPTPLAPTLGQIGAINDRTALAWALGATLRDDVDVLNNTNLHSDNLFGAWIAQDLDDPTRYAVFLLQGGLTMPDRDYYLDPSPQMADIRARCQAHIAATLALAGLDNAPAKAAAIFELEHRMAQVHVSRADSEDVRKGDNHWAVGDFTQRAPGLDWQAFFVGARLAQQREFVVWQPGALIGLSALVASVPLATWRDYLQFHAIERNAAYLPKAFVAEHFRFHEHVLSGTPQLAPRWKRAVDETSAALGEAVGKLYVQRYFPPAEKARAEAMVRNLLAAFAARIDRLEWMAPGTRAEAKAKLATLKIGIGYPEQWRDYAALDVVRGDAFGNAQRASLFNYQHGLAKLGTPVDRGEWAMNPQLVNAVNLPALNALNIPAAVLQPPFFDPKRDPAMDYAATGTLIGHEISHSFDDQGAQFDSSGRLRNWWTADDFAHFQAAGARLVEQFNAYRPFPDIHVNGAQTLSENIADVAGLSAAYDAWHASLAREPAPAAAGALSGEQLFFVSFAQKWRRKLREPELRKRIVTDGHAPAEYRADTVRNLDEWYQAFQVTAAQKLYLAPAARVRVW